GLADATIGVMMLLNETKIMYHHKRNVLREIWLATETSSVYPPSIWYYLNQHESNKPSLREQLIESWKKFGQIQAGSEKKREKAMAIYFSDGGEYTVDELENRANMYDQTESAIKLMKQDLRDLMQEIGNI